MTGTRPAQTGRTAEGPAARRSAAGSGAFAVGMVGQLPGCYFTLRPVQAAPTALYSALSAPYRSVAAFSVAVRAAA